MQQLTLDDLIYLGVRGTVLALDRNSGNVVWSTPLKGYEFVNVVIDGPDLFATARGEIFCIDRATGQIRWNNPLRGFGYGLVAIASSANPEAALFGESNRRAQECSNASASIT